MANFYHRKPFEDLHHKWFLKGSCFPPFDKQTTYALIKSMKKFARICLILCVLLAAIVLSLWAFPAKIKHYTADELIGLTCQELGEKHEEVIFAYHDAEIDHYKKSGAFQDDLGAPPEDVIPYVILMKKVIQDSNLEGFDLSKPFFHSASVATPRLHTAFFSETTSVCARSPTLDATQAMLQAATNLKLIADPMLQ